MGTLRRLLVVAAISAVALFAAERKAIFPPGVKPVGPYSPGIVSGDFLYVSGQGARDVKGNLPADATAQIRQTLDNIRAVVESAGMKMDNVIYTQVYLTDMAYYEYVDEAFSRYFPKPPARVVVGVYKLPTDTPLEISAVAYNGDAVRQHFGGAYPASLQAGPRTYVAGLLARRTETHKLPPIMSKQVEIALDSVESICKDRKVELTTINSLTVYHTAQVTRADMDTAISKRGWKVTPTYVEVKDLPSHVNIEVAAIAAPDLVFTTAQQGTTEDALGKLRTELTAAGTSLDNVVAANVYINTLEWFADMNKTYATFFGETAPARTTVQMSPFKEAKPNIISLVAVK